jgi:hypothetical protein
MGDINFHSVTPFDSLEIEFDSGNTLHLANYAATYYKLEFKDNYCKELR